MPPNPRRARRSATYCVAKIMQKEITLTELHAAMSEGLKHDGFRSIIGIGKSFGGGLLLSYHNDVIVRKVLDETLPFSMIVTFGILVCVGKGVVPCQHPHPPGKWISMRLSPTDRSLVSLCIRPYVKRWRKYEDKTMLSVSGQSHEKYASVSFYQEYFFHLFPPRSF